MQITDKSGNETLFLYVASDIIVDQHAKQIYDPLEGYSDIADSVGTIVPEKKYYKLALFSESRETLVRIEYTRRELEREGLT